jgi:DNA-directed RNA polymerase specialized sigma24 family protein
MSKIHLSSITFLAHNKKRFMKSPNNEQLPTKCNENIDSLKSEYNNFNANFPLKTRKLASFHYQQEHIVPLLQRQDSAAIEQLYDAYGGTLYGVVLRIVLSKELAEQVIQDTFLKVWHHGAQYDASKGRLFTWLLKIARNCAIDATRNTYFLNRKKTDHIDNLNNTWGGECVNPDTVGLKEIVDKMDEKYKVIVDLIYFNQYTHQEAAEEMGIPLGTVKTRVRCALLELKKTFEL